MMQVAVILLSTDGIVVGGTHVNFPGTIGSNSDLIQKVDRYILCRGSRHFTYHRLTGELMCAFKEREVICV